MRKALTVLIDLAGGLVLVGVTLLAVVVLLQSPYLVYAVLPLLAVAALAVGIWRGHASTLPAWLVVATLNLLLVLLVAFAAGRAWLLWLLPVVGVAFAAIGVVAARRPAVPGGWRAGLSLLAAAVLVLGAMGPRFARALVNVREVREPAAAFQLALPAGGTVAAQQLRGRVAVLDFWATWCAPCQHELPELDRLYRRLAADRRVVFYAVDVPMTDSPGDQGDTPAKAADFFRRHGYGLPLAFDTGGAAGKALEAHGLPTLLVLDRDGRVRLRHVGFVGAEDLGATLGGTIDRLLAEEPTAAP